VTAHATIDQENKTHKKKKKKKKKTNKIEFFFSKTTIGNGERAVTGKIFQALPGQTDR